MIVAAYRVQNEGRWIGESLMRSMAVADRAIVFDDHSTDDTVKIAERFPNVEVVPSPHTGVDEARDRGFLLRRCIDSGARWILTLDGDEVLTPSAIEEIQDFHASSDRGGKLMQRIAFLWDKTNQERCDAVYHRFMQNIFWSVFDQPKLLRHEFVFRRKFTSNRHSGRCPRNHQGGRRVGGNAAVKHYGYLYRADRERKYTFKSKADPIGERDGQYGHIVEKPTRHAPGPAKFRSFADV